MLASASSLQRLCSLQTAHDTSCITNYTSQIANRKPQSQIASRTCFLIRKCSSSLGRLQTAACVNQCSDGESAASHCDVVVFGHNAHVVNAMQSASRRCAKRERDALTSRMLSTNLGWAACIDRGR